jgi:hypothetical protein
MYRRNLTVNLVKLNIHRQFRFVGNGGDELDRQFRYESSDLYISTGFINVRAHRFGLEAARDSVIQGRVVVADNRANVFDTEYAAAYEGALNRVPVSPLTSIEIGEQVAVIWDIYGKGYWACYVRTSKGVRGWALWTSLKMAVGKLAIRDQPPSATRPPVMPRRDFLHSRRSRTLW